jgi:4-hydroxybenzoate polyprenyltransferase
LSAGLAKCDNGLDSPIAIDPTCRARATLSTTEPLKKIGALDYQTVYVDLDGSLIATDLLYESVLDLLRRRPWSAPRIIGWLMQGKAQLKQGLARESKLEFASLPYQGDVIDFLRACREQGHSLVLATAADEALAAGVAAHLGMFDAVLASDGQTNLKGPNKLRAIQAHSESKRFAYVGNGPEDLTIWAESEEAIAVRPDAALLARVRKLDRPVRVLGQHASSFSALPRLMRVHQWAKNALLFVPLFTGHQLGNWKLMLACSCGIIAFSLAASSIYILNDLMDLPSDRVHPRKRSRPLASGAISIPAGLAVAMILLAASIGLCLPLPLAFLATLLAYLLTTTLYTFLLKKKLILDVICLAALYTLRILAGGAATGVEISTWLMAFSMFFFLSLAFVKRFTELNALPAEQEGWLPGRGYHEADLDMIRSVGPASGYLAILVVCLYLNDPVSVALYPHPRWLLLMCPIILYWITRVWFLAQRGKLHSDPVVFALTDRKSWLAGIFACAVYAAARWL